MALDYPIAAIVIWIPVAVFFIWDRLSALNARYSTKHRANWEPYGWGDEWNSETQSYAKNPFGKPSVRGLDTDPTGE